VEGNRAFEEVVGLDPSGDYVRVGHGRLRSAPAVAGRAGIGARALRADLQRTGGIEPGDRAAARADLDDIDHRNLDGVAGEGRSALEVVVARQADRAALDEGGLRGRVADVERDEVRLGVRPARAKREMPPFDCIA
jgi:hypothetical protein